MAKMMGSVHSIGGAALDERDCAEVEHELAEDGFAVAVDEVVEFVDSGAAELDGDQAEEEQRGVGCERVPSAESLEGAGHAGLSIAIDWLRESDGQLGEIGAGFGSGVASGEIALRIEELGVEA